MRERISASRLETDGDKMELQNTKVRRETQMDKCSDTHAAACREWVKMRRLRKGVLKGGSSSVTYSLGLMNKKPLKRKSTEIM